MAAVSEPVTTTAPPPAVAPAGQPLLEVADLKTWFFTRDGIVRAVDGVSFQVMPGETLAIVGESGCGKSVTALSVLRLVPSPPGRIVSGAIRLAGRDLLDLSEAEMRDVRGNDISMIFQEPMTSLNPVLTIGRQIGETLILHQGLDRKAALRRAVEMLRLVHIAEAQRRITQYPHQLSGGMRQRVMIAMALACNPKLLIADEPTTALDVTIQAQILALIDRLKDDFDSAVILITHDLGVVAEVAQEILVMYAGRIVEHAGTREVFYDPQHPYTWGLLGAIPRIDRPKTEQLYSIEGAPPSLIRAPEGCKFRPRCPHAFAKCSEEPMLETRVGEPGHLDRCWLSVEKKRQVRDATIHGEAAA